MTNEEAISILKSWRITGDKSHEAVDMSIEALEKQTPKKPTDGKSCPNCGKDMWMEEYKFCHYCGQKILWT